MGTLLHMFRDDEGLRIHRNRWNSNSGTGGALSVEHINVQPVEYCNYSHNLF